MLRPSRNGSRERSCIRRKEREKGVCGGSAGSVSLPVSREQRRLVSQSEKAQTATFLLNKLQSRADQENYSRRGREGAERNRTQIMRKAS